MVNLDPALDPTFITLGPEGTCHDEVTQRYIDFQGLAAIAQIELVDDLVDGIDRVQEAPNSFAVQCSAHQQVNVLTMRYPQEVHVVDTFLYPNIPLALVVRKDVEEPKSLAIMPATAGYTDVTRWKTVTHEQSNPVVAKMLLHGKVDAGITFASVVDENPDSLRVAEDYGEVDTTWIVYGKRRRYAGQLIGQKIPWLFTGQANPEA